MTNITGRLPRLAKLSQVSLEQRIVDLESQLAAVDKDLADPQVYRDGLRVKQLHDRRSALVQELAPLEQEWTHRATPPD